MIYNKVGFLLLLVFSLVGCTSFPQEAPRLSVEIGRQIHDAKHSHLALLTHYFKEKHNRIDEFIDRVWIPEFAKKIFKKPTINKAWNRIVKSDNKKQRLIFITRIGTLIQKKINAKRIELLRPLHKLEDLLNERLNNHYDTMMSANSTLTVFLQSTAAVKDLQHRTLKKLKLDLNWSRHIGKADEIIEKIVSSKGAYEKNKDKINKILDKLK